MVPRRCTRRRTNSRRGPPRPATPHPAELARYLGTYAQLVITLRGTASTTGLDLMSALRPPTRTEKNEAADEFERAFNADALTAVYQHMEREVPDEHPMLKGSRSSDGPVAGKVPPSSPVDTTRGRTRRCSPASPVKAPHAPRSCRTRTWRPIPDG
ncbi:hypothetical protein ABZ896_13530 [Streptomyces sp. NPDC047072]|uniref:hypothetical protein n=1 Tax=Streptomyces sp. NPDC047072 TaxID=3154809 RepID=UPI00340EEC7F